MVMTANSGSYSGPDYLYPSGFDGGNTDSCFATIDSVGRETVVTIPSAIVEGSSEKLDLFRSAVHGENVNVDPYKQDIQVVYEDVNYYVGYLALRQSKRSSTQKGDDTRYHSPEQLVRLLATSGLAIPEQSYQVSLVTTVPVGYYSKDLRKRVKSNLEGSFRFVLNGREREATIIVRKVMVEGPAALVLYGAGSAGRQRLIIDGGGYTTDFTLLEGNDPIAEKCAGIDLGVEDIGNHLCDVVQSKYGRKLTLRERSDILRAYASGVVTTMPSIYCGRQDIPVVELHAIVTDGCRKVANATLAHARTLWGVTGDVVAGDVRWQYHIGGSALFYNDLLRSKMPDLQPVSNAGQANARGSARIAKALGG